MMLSYGDSWLQQPTTMCMQVNWKGPKSIQKEEKMFERTKEKEETKDEREKESIRQSNEKKNNGECLNLNKNHSQYQH